MNIINKIIFLFVAVLGMSSCTNGSSGDSDCLIIPMTKTMANTYIREKKDFGYPEFCEEPRNPASRVANKLFQGVICSQEADSYEVKYTEVETKTDEIYAESWMFDFIHSQDLGAKPTLDLFFFACEGAKDNKHCTDIAVSKFQQKSDVKLIKSSFNDSIITLKSKDADTELFCVCRVIKGPNNISLVIKAADNAQNPSFSKEELLARIESLSKEDLFPNELIRYKVDENLRDLELQFATALVKRDHFQNECTACATLLEKNEATAHVIVKSDKDAENVKLVVGRPLVSQIVEEKSCSLQAMKEQELCIGSQSVIPGERVSLSVQDSKGAEIESYEFCPNPIIARSSLDDGQVTAEIFDKNYFVLTSNLREKLVVESVSAYERRSSLFDCTNEDMHILIAPALKDTEGGVALVKFIRESGEELKLSLPWGSNRDYMLQRLPKSKVNL